MQAGEMGDVFGFWIIIKVNVPLFSEPSKNESEISAENDVKMCKLNTFVFSHME